MKKILDFLGGNVIKEIGGIIDNLFTTDEERLEAKNKIFKVIQEKELELQKMQTDIIIAEAKGNWFQAGWRPATGWVCVAGFAVNFLISPLAAAFGIIIPQADTSVMLPVLMGMLGLGAMRTIERGRKNG